MDWTCVDKGEKATKVPYCVRSKIFPFRKYLSAANEMLFINTSY